MARILLILLLAGCDVARDRTDPEFGFSERRRSSPDDFSAIPSTSGGKSFLPITATTNVATVQPGKSQSLFDFTSPDKDAQVYTLTVSPMPGDGDPGTEQFAPGDEFSQTLAAAGGPVPALALENLHYAAIDFGIGSASRRIYVDLKRGFKVSLPASRIRVTVYNVSPAFGQLFYSGPLIVIGSIAPGDASDGFDELTFTQVQYPMALAGQYDAVVPPFARKFTAYTSDAAGGYNAAFNLGVQQFRNNVSIWDNGNPAGIQFGPYDLLSSVTHVRFNPTNMPHPANGENLTLVWSLAL